MTRATSSRTSNARGSGWRTLPLVALLTGCYTTSNVVTVPALDTKYPVSASSQFIDARGQIVDSGRYTVVRPFRFERTMETPRHETKEAALQMTSDLDPIVSSAGGDAVTNLRVEATDYDAGSHGSAAGWKIAGWTFGITGGTLLLAGLSSDDAELKSELVTTGAVFAAVGGLALLLSHATSKPAKWQFAVTGDVVRMNPAQPVGLPLSASPAPLAVSALSVARGHATKDPDGRTFLRPELLFSSGHQVEYQRERPR